MTKRFLVLLAALVSMAALASAKSYFITLYEPSVIGGTELKPGEYRLELNSDKVVIRKGKQMGEAPVKVETAESKYSSTTVRYRNGDGKYHISEIHLGGTNMKLVVTAD
ncbi:MAG TPA: hypothetical protein VJN43_19660 [Bryobacteraceae bacterium]|nr:hypothetical protein [Bryobacteraceae bacterium]